MAFGLLASAASWPRGWQCRGRSASGDAATTSV